MNSKKGVSLVVLGITAVVISILTGLVVVNVNETVYDEQGNKVHTNSITEAREVKFKNNITNAREELESYILIQKANNPNFDVSSVTTINKENSQDAIRRYIRKPSQEVLDYLKIINGKFYIRKDVDFSKTMFGIEKWLKEDLKIPLEK